MVSIAQLYRFTKNYSFAPFQWVNFYSMIYLTKSKKRER